MCNSPTLHTPPPSPFPPQIIPPRFCPHQTEIIMKGKHQRSTNRQHF
jgi:hypothetical protein